MQSTCPGCGRYYTHQLQDTWMVVCSHCHTQMTERDIQDKNAFDMPDDLSTIQIGTTGVYKVQNFTITGRVRFQSATDFRNLWCAKYSDKTIWIGQSLESIGFFTPPFTTHPDQFSGLAADVFVDFTDKIKLKCEIFERCKSIRFEGEISSFPYPNDKPTMIQARNAAGNTALIFVGKSGELCYLWGEILPPQGFKLDNLKKWTEW